jgi:hypothetical protein
MEMGRLYRVFQSSTEKARMDRGDKICQVATKCKEEKMMDGKMALKKVGSYEKIIADRSLSRFAA